MLRRKMQMFQIMGVIVMSIASGTFGAGQHLSGETAETVIFEENFESGKLTGWETQGGKIEIVKDGDNQICKIVSDTKRRRQKGEESVRWDDSTEGAFIFHDLPTAKLHNKRVYLHARYRLSDVAKDNDWVGFSIVHFDATGVEKIYTEGKKRWIGGPILESRDPKKWTNCRIPIDMAEKVADTKLRIGFGKASGTLLIDSIRLTVTSKTPPERFDEAIVDNSDAKFSKTGEWNTSTKVPGYLGGDYLWAPQGDGAAKAIWSLKAPSKGLWEVQGRWTWGLSGSKDRATNAPFTLKFPGGSREVRVNMADKTLAGRFNPLGVVDLADGEKVEVTLSNDADNSVVADAVRLVRLPEGCTGSELLYENTFSGTEPEKKAEADKDWIMEGGGIVKWDDGFLRMRAKNYTVRRSKVETDHFVYWLNRDFPADFAVEWDFRFPDKDVSPYGLAIIFFCAKGMNGEDIFDPKLQKREGRFGRYFAGDINCYHVSYYASARGRANIRKNHGFFLVDASDDIVAAAGPNKWHRLRLSYFGGLLELSVNGKRCLSWFDDGETFGPRHGGGKLGFRQQNDLFWGDYTNVRVYELKRK